MCSMKNIITLLIMAICSLSLTAIDTIHAAETRGLRVMAKDPESGQSAEVKLYNKSYAVIIGIDRYQNLPADRQLSYAVRDAKGIEATLKRNYRFDKIYTLFDAEASRDQIMRLLTRELPKTVGKEDALFIFWAGHGNQENTSEGELGYLIPFDGNSEGIYGNVTMDQLKNDISKAIPAKHVFYAFDACYSGLLTSRAVDKKINRDLAYLKEITKERVRQVLTAGGKGQEVLDGGPRGHSVFTGRLIEALEAAGDYITANEIQTILKERVYQDARARGHEQTPGYGTLYGTGDFVFIPNIQQQVEDTKTDIARLEKEQSELEASETAAIRANDASKRQEAELARKSGEAKLRAAQLRDQQLVLEAQKRLADEQERQRLERLKGEDEQKLARLKDDVAKKRQQVQSSTKTDTLEAAVAENKRLNARIVEIETAFEAELATTRQQVANHYATKLAELEGKKRDEFESNSEFSERISKKRAQLTSQQAAELAALTAENAAAKETTPLKESIKKLSEKQFTVSSDHIAIDLGVYDADKQHFPVALTSKSALVKLAMNGTIPLPRDKAKSFKQQYLAGAIRPTVTVKTGSGEALQVALISDADNSLLMPENGEFMTAAGRKQKEKEAKLALVEERKRLIYTDPKTKLQWVRNGNLAGEKLNWQDAMNWAANLNYAGYSDWRLPTKDELAAFAKNTGSYPVDFFNANGFPNIQGMDFYWAAATRESSNKRAWRVNMMLGVMERDNKDFPLNYVWPVRSGQF